ncbi:MAG: tyrosine-protein kinase family protein, partial [Chitinophagaceae bacterium]
LAVELGDVEKELKQYKMDNEVYDITGQTSLAFSKLTDLDKAQSDANIKLAVCKMLEEYISDKANIFNKVPGTLGIEDPTLLAASTLYNELVLEREKKIKETTPNNFYVKEIELKISRAREAFLETIRNIKRTFELMATDLAGQKARYNSEVKAVPQKERGLREIARQQGIKENLYLYLLQKREETAITLASTISNSRVVDFAFRPTLPISPIHKNIYLIGMALGLLVPLLFIYLRELLNDKVESVEDINRVIDVPIIGSVSHSTENQMLVVGQHSRKVISEQFRIIRTNLQYFTQQSRQNIVLVTSTFSGEGKSFVSTNLAAVIALTGKKTIVLEFDIRKPKVASGFNIISKKGISNFLIGGAQIDEIIFPVPDVPNLFVIPCGPIPPNPAEILLSDKLNALFEEVKSRFDMILIDSAPLGMVSDAFELAKYANNTVYVVRQRYTQKNQLKVIHQIYQEKRLPALSILLNDVKLKGVGAYGYHMYGGYGYGYGYGAGSSYLETESNGSANGKKHKRSIFEKFK